MASLYKRNGSGIWWVRFQLNRTRVQRSSHTSKKAQALRFLAKVMEEVRYLSHKTTPMCGHWEAWFWSHRSG